MRVHSMLRVYAYIWYALWSCTMQSMCAFHNSPLWLDALSLLVEVLEQSVIILIEQVTSEGCQASEDVTSAGSVLAALCVIIITHTYTLQPRYYMALLSTALWQPQETFCPQFVVLSC